MTKLEEERLYRAVLIGFMHALVDYMQKYGRPNWQKSCDNFVHDLKAMLKPQYAQLLDNILNKQETAETFAQECKAFGDWTDKE